jgi:uncharacterized Fe-S cluster protein YjdI
MRPPPASPPRRLTRARRVPLLPGAPPSGFFGEANPLARSDAAPHSTPPRLVRAPPRVPRRLQVYETEAITVTFDPARCIHAAECIRAQPAVFDSSRRRWVRPELGTPAQIAAAVHRCPTGALHYALRLGPDEEAEAASIRARRHGPLYVRGAVRLETEDGVVLGEDLRLALCRCGASKNQPFCDGSHREVGFRDPA